MLSVCRCGGLDGQKAGGREKGHSDLRAARDDGATPAIGRGRSSHTRYKEEEVPSTSSQIQDQGMAHYEAAAPPAADSSSKWPHDSLSHHLGVHAPLQVSRCTDAAPSSVYHAMHSQWQAQMRQPPPAAQQTSSNLYRGGPCFPPQVPMQQYAAAAAAIQQQQQQNGLGTTNGVAFNAYDEANRKLLQDWHSANNNKMNEGYSPEKTANPGWSATNGGVISPARPQAQHGVALLSPPLQQPASAVLNSPIRNTYVQSHPKIAAPQPEYGVPSTFLTVSEGVKAESTNTESKMEIQTEFTPSPKSEERKSAETGQDTTSYDASGSLSVTDSDDLADRHLDVEIGRDGSPIVVSEERPGEDTPQLSSSVSDTDTPASKSNVTPNSNQDSEGDDSTPASENGGEQRVNGEAKPATVATIVATTTTQNNAEKDDENSPQSLLLNFSQKSFGALSTKIENGEAKNTAATTPQKEEERPPAPTASFCRPPGLGPPPAFPTVLTHSSQQPLVCPICGFSCTSKFHYNSHMNTHGDHQCTMCDYTSRTEGRLKRHMRESHTAEQQLAAGLEVDSHAAGANSTPSSASATAVVTSTSTLPIDAGLSTTMASLMDVANLAANLAAGHSEKSDCLAPPPTPFPSALDQIRAFTEKTSLLPDPGMNIASALGVMSQAMLGGVESTNGNISGGSGASAGSGGGRSPEQRRSSGGKPKTYKCKQCQHVSMSKEEQWAHARTHIPVEKQMSCPKCNFVTEYKHHLEYHLRNHIGSKPFQCKKCSYTCVNKSMLNSHMKSHTNIYQFRCRDCTYATKYCHSLKLHLRKYNHRRVPDVGGEGGSGSGAANSANPSSPSTPMSMVSTVEASSALQRLGDSFGSLDVTGPQPGPQTTLAQTLGLAPIVSSQSLNYASQMFMRQQQIEMENMMRLPQLKCQLCDFQSGSQEEFMRHNMAHLINQQQQQQAAQQQPITTLYQQFPSLPLLPTSLASVVAAVAANANGTSEIKTENGNGTHEEPKVNVDVNGDEPMSASPEGDSAGSSGSPMSKASGDEADNPNRSRKRKAKAFKLDQIAQRLQKGSPGAEENNDGEASYRSLVNPAPLQVSSAIAAASLPQPIPNNPAHAFQNLQMENGNLNLFQQAFLLNALKEKQRDLEIWRFQCSHCRMAFQDQALYHIHMGYHGYEHPFKCNRCGATQLDALNFNLHLLQASHE